MQALSQIKAGYYSYYVNVQLIQLVTLKFFNHIAQSS